MKLFAPRKYGKQPCTFWEAGMDLRDSVTGGCGPGGFGDYLVPDKLLRLSIRPSCRIHDWCYAWGVTRTDKKEADDIFLDNMLIQIACGTKWLKLPRRWLAKRYYNAVAWLGSAAYWKNKDEQDMGSEK